MPNHVHFIMVPATPDGLRATFAEAHRRYTARINARLKVTGHLWQGRFSSTAMDERHLLAAARYVPMNPVRAGLTRRAQDWPWSSARAHLAGKDDGVTTVAHAAGAHPRLRRLPRRRRGRHGRRRDPPLLFHRPPGRRRPTGSPPSKAPHRASACGWQARPESQGRADRCERATYLHTVSPCNSPAMCRAQRKLEPTTSRVPAGEEYTWAADPTILG